MKNKIDEFIKKNKSIIEKKNEKNFSTLIIDRGYFYPAFIASIYSAVTNKKYKHKIHTLIQNNQNDKLKNFYKSFGVNNIISRPKMSKNLFIYFQTFFQTLKAVLFIKKNGFPIFINKFNFLEIPIGDLIYDTYIRYNNRYLDPKVDASFFNIIFGTILKLTYIKKIISTHKVKIIIISQDTYASYGAIALRLGNKLKIKVIEPCTDLKQDHFFFDYNKFSVNHGPYNFYYRYVYKRKNPIKNLKISHKKLNEFLKKRYLGNTNLAYTSVKDLPKQKKILLSREDLIKNLKIKKKVDKIVILACHSFSDAPHGQGKNIIFQDFYQQAKETLLFLNNNSFKNVLWLVRPHPSSRRYNEQGIIDNLYKKIIKNKNSLVKMCPKNITIKNLIKISDFAITLKGTMAIEFASEGKYSLCCSESPFSKLGISIEVKKKKEYFKVIKNINKIPKKLLKSKSLKAKKILYLLEKSIPPNHIKDSKIFNKKSLRNRNKISLFNNKLVEDCAKGKLLNDPFYLNIYKKL